MGTSSARFFFHAACVRSSMKARVSAICCGFRRQKEVSPRVQAYSVRPAECPASFKLLSNLHNESRDTAAFVWSVERHMGSILPSFWVRRWHEVVHSEATSRRATTVPKSFAPRRAFFWLLGWRIVSWRGIAHLCETMLVSKCDVRRSVLVGTCQSFVARRTIEPAM